MADKVEPEIAKIGIRLVDDAYLAWMAAESESARALRAWSDVAARHGEDAYYAYLAALDREEAAARDLQRLWALAEPCRDTLTEEQDSIGPAPSAASGPQGKTSRG
jgi:hypothetical protein